MDAPAIVSGETPLFTMAGLIPDSLQSWRNALLDIAGFGMVMGKRLPTIISLRKLGVRMIADPHASPHGVAMQVLGPEEPLVATQLTMSPPSRGWVLVRIMATGVCHADIATSSGRSASPDHPVTPGHEIAGVIETIGEDVTGWRVGDRVAVGWFGGSCGHCHWCRAGKPVHCPDRKVPGISYPGGWADRIAVPTDALARIPDTMDFFTAAPMGCAGVTTFNAVRQAGTPAGGRVAIFGIGGLGHLAVQFASRMGYETIAIARGAERASLVHELGARHYIDSDSTDPGEALRSLGGADHIISTAPTTKPVAGLWRGLNPYGRITLLGVDKGAVSVPVAQLVTKAQTISGHLTGSTVEIEEAMNFAAVNDVTPWVERRPLADANEAVSRLRAGRVRFRIVLDPGAAGD